VTDPLVVAIDGPAGSGKSTVGRHVAERLGLEVLDTGAMYRAVTLLVLRAGIDPADADKVAKVAKESNLVVGERVVSDGRDLTDELRTDDVNAAVSVVSANPAVRSVLVAQQREWVRTHGGGVVEGRDIGSVVFPHATVKVFLTASHEARAERRPEEGPDGLARRDRLDKSRTASPLVPADDAHHIDTTDRPASEVAEEVLGWL
jgi:cytidylate kinase